MWQQIPLFLCVSLSTSSSLCHTLQRGRAWTQPTIYRNCMYTRIRQIVSGTIEPSQVLTMLKGYLTKVFLQPSRPTKKPLFTMENILSDAEDEAKFEFSMPTHVSSRAQPIQLQEKRFVKCARGAGMPNGGINVKVIHIGG